MNIKLILFVVGLCVGGYALTHGVSDWIVALAAVVFLLFLIFFPSKKDAPKATTWGSENRSELSKKIDER